MEPQQTINVTIRSMRGTYSTMGIALESNDELCPKLKPLEVVALPTDHILFESESSMHIELSRSDATRPYRFESVEDLIAYQADDEKNKVLRQQYAAQVGTSKERSAQIREENKRQRDELIAKGINPDPAQVNLAVQAKLADTADGLAPVNVNNAVPRGKETDDTAPVVPPKSSSRRGRK